MSEYAPYNPLEKRHLAGSVAEALLERKPHPLVDVPKFNGAGIYAIYYTGIKKPFPAYAVVAAANKDGRLRMPIYVGKADPPGGRMGGFGLDEAPNNSLSKRLREHASSIRAAASTLDPDDFFYRALVVEEQWIGLAEGLLIAKLSPIWNTLLDGFGNHAPGSGRDKGMCPRWDVLHPGRKWAVGLPARPETSAQIAAEVEAQLRARAIPSDPKLLED